MADLPEDIEETVGAQLAPGETPRAGYVEAEDQGKEAHVVTDRRVIGAEIDRSSGTLLDISHYLLTDDRIFGATYEEETSMSEWVALGVVFAILGGIGAWFGATQAGPFVDLIAFVGIVILIAGVAIAVAAWGDQTEITVKVHSTAQSKEWTLPLEGEDLAQEIVVVVGENQS